MNAGLSGSFDWLGMRDSNSHIQSQSLLCCHYTNPQYLITFERDILYHIRRRLSRGFRKFPEFFRKFSIGLFADPILAYQIVDISRQFD